MRYIMALALLTFLAAPTVGKTQSEHETLIATNQETRSASLVAMRNGLTSVTFVWPMGDQTPQNVDAIQAGMFSVLTGGTESRTPSQIATFMRQKGVSKRVSTLEDNLLLTVSAPDDVFPEVLVHLENLLLKATYSDDWYARELRKLRRPIASTTRQSSDVLSRVERFLNYANTDEEAQSIDPRFRFGKPSQVVLRSNDAEVTVRTRRLLAKLPPDASRSRLGDWLQRLVNRNSTAFTLPRGIIHFADPTSSETLLFLVSAQEFQSEAQQLGANLLLDYIGSNQGSEMFRIIRQELRASYDPESRFVVLGDKRALLVLSATVEAAEWPEIHGRMRGIYRDVRHGKVDQKGLEIQYAQLKQSYEDKLFFDAVWTAEQYLRAHPEGATGDIEIPIFNAFGQVNFDEIIDNANDYLPPFEDFLLVVVGGGVAPPADLTRHELCSLEKFEPIDHCLKSLPSGVSTP
ncbi:hypothetical protein KUV51_00660 [Tateyamaria omphalii]|uniref:hypothetical protein n=1 Tax=Tateyamaria omphalii TaxID=299262 RepID=UPI001C9958C3|nr:hypothetical protein [Tateyamaria omphalii]MBY5931491.1 hypothetical protein [Tateyamaria omphalii]